MGEVYRARDGRLGEQGPSTLLDPQGPSEPGRGTTGSGQTLAYIVMQYLEGETSSLYRDWLAWVEVSLLRISALVFGQFVGQQPVSAKVIAAGAGSWIVFAVLAFRLTGER